MGRTGANSILAYQNGGPAWGTAAAPGAGDGILGWVDSLINTADMTPDEAPGLGIMAPNYIDKTMENVEPTITMPFRWTGRLWSLIAGVMGDDTVTGVGPTYTHTMNLTEDPVLYGTLAAEIGGSDIFEWPSVLPIGFDFGFGDNFLTFTVRTIANTVEFGANATTTGADFDAVTYATKAQKVGNLAIKLRTNEESSGALVDGQTRKVSGLNLTVNRSVEREFLSQGVTTGAEWQTDRPVRGGHDEILLQYNVLEGSNSMLTRIQEYDNETNMKADLTITQTVGGNSFSLTIQLPSLKPMPPEYALDAVGRLPLTYNYRAQTALSTPTGMSNTNPIHIILVNTDSASYE